MKILALCGSLRSESSNAIFLNTVQKLYSQHSWIEFKISNLPYFEPELQYSENLPASVADLRAKAASADLILIVTPEYAHAAPGVLKNALEWMFYEGTMKKPVVLLIGAAQGEHTRDQLVEVIATMDFQMLQGDSLILKNPRSKFMPEGGFKSASDEAYVRGFLDSYLK